MCTDASDYPMPAILRSKITISHHDRLNLAALWHSYETIGVFHWLNPAPRSLIESYFVHRNLLTPEGLSVDHWPSVRGESLIVSRYALFGASRGPCSHRELIDFCSKEWGVPFDFYKDDGHSSIRRNKQSITFCTSHRVKQSVKIMNHFDFLGYKVTLSTDFLYH